MKKWLILALLAVGAIGLIRLASRPRPEGESSETIWDKLGSKMAEMPEDFPPRVMFDNIATTKETTQHILELLEKSERSAEQETDLVATAHDGQGRSD